MNNTFEIGPLPLRLVVRYPGVGGKASPLPSKIVETRAKHLQYRKPTSQKEIFNGA